MLEEPSKRCRFVRRSYCEYFRNEMWRNQSTIRSLTRRIKTYIGTSRILEELIRRNGLGIAEFLLRIVAWCRRRRNRFPRHVGRSMLTARWWRRRSIGIGGRRRSKSRGRLRSRCKIAEHVPVRVATAWLTTTATARQQVIQTGIPNSNGLVH